MFFSKKFQEESSYLRYYLKKYKKPAALGLLALFTVDALEIVPPLILKEAVDAISSEDPQWALLKLSMLYILVSVIQSIGRFSWRYYLIRTSMNAGRDLREEYGKQLFQLPPSFYDKTKIGDLMSLATSDIEAIRMAMGGGLIIFGDAVIYLLTVPVAMFWLSPELTMYSLIPLIVVPFIVVRNERLIHDRFTKVQESFSELAALAQENLMGIRVVKGFGREHTQIEKFRKAGLRYMEWSLQLARTQSAFGPLLDFVMSCGMVILLWLGGGFVIQDTLTLGTFVAFQRYIQKMIWPMTAVGLSVSFYQRAVAGSERVKKVMAETTNIIESPSPIRPKNFTLRPDGRIRTEGHLVVRNLSFRYPGTEPLVLKNISFELKPGQRLGIVGQVGCGKSTLANIIPRLYPIADGHVFLDGVDINHWPLKDLRDQIGFVSQDTFLFNETVFENVALGLFEWQVKSEKERRVLNSTAQASVHNDVLNLDRQYETSLGERGLNVSGGQKQRLTLARALATEPSLLVLDDALSAIDVATEKSILDSLRTRTGRNSEIVIAHRLSAVQESDLILVLHKGEIVQSGKHSELIRDTSGLYWSFYEKQRIEQEIAKMGEELNEPTA